MPDPSLVFAETGRTGPGLHAFLIGVSAYPYLKGGRLEARETYGLGQLDSPARTVRNLAALLLERRDRLVPPLKTLRILTSPSPNEAALDLPVGQGGLHPTLADLPAATLKNIRQAASRWREDASFNREDATLFYFAGHGIQRSRGDAVLLLEDVLEQDGGPPLSHAVDVNNIYNGMGNPSLRNIAQTQIYVVDACRTSIGALKNYVTRDPAPVFEVEAEGTDDRVAPIFMAAGAGHVAYGTNGGMSLFGQDFITCLSGGAAECFVEEGQPSWVLTIGELHRVLSQLVRADNEKRGGMPRTFHPDKYTASLETQLMRFDGPPEVACTFLIDPEVARSNVILRLSDALDNSAYVFPGPPLDPHPHPCKIKAGRYRVFAQDASYAHVPEFIEVKPPRFKYAFYMKQKGVA